MLLDNDKILQQDIEDRVDFQAQLYAKIKESVTSIYDVSIYDVPVIQYVKFCISFGFFINDGTTRTEYSFYLDIDGASSLSENIDKCFNLATVKLNALQLHLPHNSKIELI